ncbi:heat shock protein transcriptional repressor HspR [Tepidiforma thermophila]|jgi:MerR family transcriptional regulator/heat shock protein HspR|uniref:MerR family transcriptional regulator/heat shock protein HspR n=1 Tax=Tepidiforma thermophila (strain KCTC 52669 / CGMCC 1.13589 / G233) TaxID=2761530 RepID=A0A2A9HCV5_TEPT2|nr:helix-turn-helix transcriptional regulator [Tepidiforma thermophila]PFG72960.1 MerR family transcriptional regulator/heat shock protein HspR [Tepidiforma thermophila]
MAQYDEMDGRNAPLDVDDDEPMYVISIAARLVGMHQQTLRYYEKVGLIRPKRTEGNIRMYSNADIQRIKTAQRLIDELGVNLAGVDIILRMNEQIRRLQAELEATRAELNRLRATRLPAPYQGGGM